MYRKYLIYGILALILICVLIPCAVDGRVGGGESYGGGGGGSSSSGGGGGGSGDLIYFLLWLIIRCPAIGIPLTIIIIVVAVMQARNRVPMTDPGYSSRSDSYGADSYRQPRQSRIIDKIAELKKTDPNFSRPLILDFLQLFFTRVHQSRGSHTWESVRPYIEQNLCSALIEESKNVVKVENVIVGSLTLVDIFAGAQTMQRLTVEFEANFTESADEKKKQDFYTKEQWFFRRKAGVLSKGPKDIASFACPSCGSPAELRADGSCPHCDKVVNNGQFHWQLYNISVITRGPRPPLALAPGGEEAGTERATVFQPDFEVRRKMFQLRYPEFTWQEFEKMVSTTFMTLQDAWMKKDWELARPLESDYLHSTHRYWIEKYRDGGLTNYLEEIEILSIIPVKIEQDAYFECITVRINARMRDYTMDGSHKVVAGNKNAKRTFSEYWTFIRRAGFSESREGEKKCPNCGAPLSIGMAGICEFCSSKLTSADFDWTLSLIEQDEAYEG